MVNVWLMAVVIVVGYQCDSTVVVVAVVVFVVVVVLSVKMSRFVRMWWLYVRSAVRMARFSTMILFQARYDNTLSFRSTRLACRRLLPSSKL